MRIIRSLVLIGCLGLCGCVVSDTVKFLIPEGPPSYEQISDSYYQTKLMESSSADVLANIHIPEYELLSQTKSVVASFGKKKKGYKSWFKMVAFDENELTARRKYICLVDERPKVLFAEPWEALRFNCEMVLDREVLDEPYANENARRIAVLKEVLEYIRQDMREISSENKKIKVFGMMINQAMETILVKLDKSPVLATNIDDPKGIEFNHINMDRGKVRMTIEDDIVTVKIRLGQYVTKLKWSQELDDY